MLQQISLPFTLNSKPTPGGRRIGLTSRTGGASPPLSVAGDWANNPVSTVPDLAYYPLKDCLAELTVYQPECPKIRLGNNFDGGYILADLPGVKPYDLIISCGISDEDSFTRDAVLKYKCPSVGFDGTITGYPNEFIVPEYPITFHRKNIAATNSADTTNLTEYLHTHRDILVKMDIESHEYKWLLSLSDTELRSIKQITLEIHQYTYDIIHKPSGQSVSPIRFQDKLRALQKLARNFVLIHAHPNNNGVILDVNGQRISDLVELTYVRRNEFKLPTGLIPNTEALPILGLDFPNVLYKPDITLNFPPFVNPSSATSSATSNLTNQLIN